MLNNVKSLPVRSGDSDYAGHTFRTYVAQMKSMAADLGLDWDFPLSHNGCASDAGGWDLRRLAKDARKVPILLRNFTRIPAADAILAQRAIRPSGVRPAAVSPAWQDLMKAHTLEHICVRRKSVAYIQQTATAWRLLATVANKEPWLVTAEDVRLSLSIADELQTSRGRSAVLNSLIKAFADPLHLFDSSPISGLIERETRATDNRARFAKKKAELASSLQERKNERRLPEQRAFWELVRIVFTEKPRSFNDALRFAMVKVLIITGLRLGEVTRLPLDWKRTRTFVDDSGRPAGDAGGISESLQLRHFAEKQGTVALYETTQFVPDLFRVELEETLATVERLTRPLRNTLRAQHETGRFLPMYEEDELVDALEMYTRIVGNPVWAADASPQVTEAVERYRSSLDEGALVGLLEMQAGCIQLGYGPKLFFHRRKADGKLRLRESNGEFARARGVRGRFLLVRDVEEYLRSARRTRASEASTFFLDSGQKMASWEMLFLYPGAATAARDAAAFVDPSFTAHVAMAGERFLQSTLGGGDGETSLFQAYGRTDEDRALCLKSHALRHLQNTELFRLGVADTVISKRFNRRSVAQSYEYDHRSLAEELDQLELPDGWAGFVGEGKAATVAKLIEAGRANGPIVREFRRIQAEEGDQAALLFLTVEADGFHATPYGYCLNSFTVDPCPKHLECFTGCRHLSASGLEENRRNIVTLHGKLKTALEAAQARPHGAVGRENQIIHGRERLAGVELLLATPSGERVFPDGPDLSQTNTERSVLHGT